MYPPNTPPFPPSGAPYGAPPFAPEGPPKVVTWFKVYAGLMAALYLFLFGLGLFMIIVGSSAGMSSQETTQALIMGIVYAVFGFVFLLLYAYGLMIPRKPWGWIYAMVLICLGLTSICCLPATIPLLIFWLKPEAKAFYGRM